MSDIVFLSAHSIGVAKHLQDGLMQIAPHRNEVSPSFWVDRMLNLPLEVSFVAIVHCDRML